MSNQRVAKPLDEQIKMAENLENMSNPSQFNHSIQ